MDKFHSNLYIFGKYSDFEWQKAELSSPVKKKKERKATKRETRNGRKFWMTEMNLNK